MRKLVAVFALAAALLLLWSGFSAREEPPGRQPRETGLPSAASTPRPPGAAPVAETSETGSADPAANATVVVHVIDEQDALVAAVKVGDQETDAQGLCRLSLPPNKDRRSLTVFHSAYAPAYLRLPVLEAGAREELWVRLLRGVTVEGRVLVEGTDEPAAGARILLTFSAAWYPLGAQESRQALVAADGSVRWEHVPAGRVAIFALAPGFEDAAGSVYFEVVPPRRTEPFVLRVVQTSQVVVRFLSERGAPIAEGTVSYTFSAGAVGIAVEETAGAKGALTVTGLPPALTEFTASAPDHKEASVEVVVKRDRTIDATISLAPALAIRGRVEGGAGATVMLGDGSGGQRSVAAGDNGRFAFEGLDAGSFRIEARVADGQRSAPLPPVAAGRHDVVLTLLPAPPLGTLELRCKDAEGRAVFQVALRLQREGGSEKTERVSDPRGIQRVADLEPGRYSVRIWAPRYAEAAVPAFVIAPGETTALEVGLGPPVRMLDISVRDVVGRPVETSRVLLFRAHDGRPLDVKPAWVFGGIAPWTLSDGRFRLPLPTEQAVVAILADAGDFETAPAFARRRIPPSRERRASVSFLVDRRLKVIACEEGDEAFQAGFRDGDLIERWDDSVPRTAGDLPALLREPATVKIRRGEKRIVLTIPAGYVDLGVDEVLFAP